MSTRLSLPVTERDHAQGPASAPATLVEYGDYECAYCRRAEPIIKAIRKDLGDKVRFVFRHHPLRELHPHAQAAAEAAEAAAAQGRFWEMHELLFQNQADLEQPSLLRCAERAGLDTSRWATDTQNHTFAGRVQEDLDSGIASGVHGTPRFFINGDLYEAPVNYDALLRAVKSAT